VKKSYWRGLLNRTTSDMLRFFFRPLKTSLLKQIITSSENLNERGIYLQDKCCFHFENVIDKSGDICLPCRISTKSPEDFTGCMGKENLSLYATGFFMNKDG
jgi:hypothetical protein